MRGEKQDKIPCRFPVIWDWSVFDLVCLIPLRFTTPPLTKSPALCGVFVNDEEGWDLNPRERGSITSERRAGARR